jgi:outer membrane protein OmpA-like peptidoglycan-associated protein
MNLRLITTALVIMLASAAIADETRIYRDGEIPDANDVARMLGAKPGVKFRSIRMLPDQKGADSASEDLRTPTSFALPLQFGFNSSDLSDTVKTQLDAVAEGIRIAAPAKVVIEGHADATGPESYNVGLSQRRAEAVKRYLVEKHALDAAKFDVVGQGEKKLLNTTDPAAAENRRVEFRGG